MSNVVCECNYEEVKKVILDEIAGGCKKFGIFPYGKYGRIVKGILNEIADVSYVVMDEKLADDHEDIYHLSILDREEYRGYTILLCSNNVQLYSELRRLLRRFVVKYRIVDVCLQNSVYAIGYNEKDKKDVSNIKREDIACECSYEQVRRVILGEISRGCKEFAIFPYKKYGHMAEDILKEQGNVSYVILDEMEADGENIHRVEILELKKYWSYTVLLCSNSLTFYTDLRGLLLRHALRNRIIDVCLQDSLFAMLQYREPRLAALECAAREIKDRNIEGNVAEAGVFRGDFAQYINIFFPTKKLYLIDTFEGFDDKDVAVDVKEAYINYVQDWSDTEVQVVLSKMEHKQNCIVKKGYFPDIMKDVDEKFCFVSIDMDLYQPIYEGLHYFYPRLNKGGYIFVHDCRNLGYLGARRAVMDFCEEAEIGYVSLQDMWGTAVITK